jgi:DNA modification methylase
LIRPAILAGSREKGIVIDPFFGSGTTGEVAVEEKRDYIGIELNPEYVRLAQTRISKIK